MQLFMPFLGLFVKAIFMKILLVFLFLFFTFFGQSQLSVTNNQTVEWYIQNVLIGTGITISNVQYNAGPGNVSIDQVGQFVDPNVATGLANGLILGSGDVTMAAQPNLGGGSTLGGGTGAGVDPDLASLTLNQINDECIVEFDFVPTGDSLVFSYVFASEEYEEYVCGGVNDAFGFFLTGTNPNGANYAATNLALVPDPLNPNVYTTTGVSINTVNPGVAGSAGTAANCAALDPNWASYNVFYAGANTGTDFEYDGNTVVLNCRAAVVCGQTYHIKLAIGDGGDGAFDSGVFIEGGSFSSPQPVVDISPVDENGDPIPNGVLPEGCIDADILLIKPIGYTDSAFTIDLNISGTAINGTDYTQINPQYTIPVGQDTLSLTITAALDGLTEGLETLIISTTFVTQCGDTILVADTLNIVDVALDYGLVFNDTTLACPTDSIMVTVQANGGIPNVDFVWDHSGETTAAVWVPANSFGTNYYPVLATDYCGITAYDSVQVTVTPSVPPSITFIDDYIFTCIDQNGVTITVDSIGGAFDVNAITYNWSPVPGNTDNITVFPTSALNWYFLTVYDGCNTVTDSVLVEVGTATIDSLVIEPALGCAGQGNAAGAVSIYPLEPNWNYTLIGNGVTIGPQTGNDFNNLVGNLIYNLLAQDPNGCILDTNIFVPQDNATLTATFVQSALQDISCNGANDGSAAIANISGGINVPNGGPFDVFWTHNNGTAIGGASNVITGGGDNVNTLFAGGWQVLVVEQTSGCAWSQSFVIEEPDVLTVSVLANDPLCYNVPNGSIIVNGTGGTTPYSIVINDSQGVQKNTPGTNAANVLAAGDYTYTITDANGCTASGITTLNNPGQINVTYNKEDILCFGRNTGWVNVTNVINYSGNYDSLQFFWTPSVTGGDGFSKTSESGMAPGDYQLTILDQNGCSNDVIITIKDTLPISIEVDKNPAYCRTASFQNGNGVVYGSATGGAGNFVYKWENLTTGQTSNNSTWAGRNPGTYRLTVIDQNNCLVSQIIELDSVSPIAAFTVSSDNFEGPGLYEGTEDVKIRLTNESQFFSNPLNPQSDTIFQWNLYTNASDGGKWFFTYDIDQRVDTTYKGEEVYNVCLIAKNYNDCKDTACVDIIVHKTPRLDLPNVFTPGAVPNNTFYFPNIGISEFKASIFNRYGVAVFEFNEITDEWDGNNYKNGSPCADGTYFYVYKAVSTNGTEFAGEGTVTLIRNK